MKAEDERRIKVLISGTGLVDAFGSEVKRTARLEMCFVCFESFLRVSDNPLMIQQKRRRERKRHQYDSS